MTYVKMCREVQNKTRHCTYVMQDNELECIFSIPSMILEFWQYTVSLFPLKPEYGHWCSYDTNMLVLL